MGGGGYSFRFLFLIILPSLLVSQIILLLMVFFLYLCENPSQMMVWVQPLYLLLSVVWQIDIGLGGKDNTWTPWRYHFTKVGRFSKRPLTTNLLLLNDISTIKCPFPSSKWFFLPILFYLKISTSSKHEWLNYLILNIISKFEQSIILKPRWITSWNLKKISISTAGQREKYVPEATICW